MNVAPMNCQELVELVTDYFDGVLSAQDSARFDEHLSKCALCRIYIAQMRTTVTLVGTLTEDHIEPRVRVELLDLFRNWKKPTL